MFNCTGVPVSWGTDVNGGGGRCVQYQNGWTGSKDSACVCRQQHGVRTQNPGDDMARSPPETVNLCE